MAAYRVAGSILVFGSEVAALNTTGQFGLVRVGLERSCILRALELSRSG
jgi:hypothetical protein